MDVKQKRSMKDRYTEVRKLLPGKVIPVSERLNYTIKDLLEGGFLQYKGKTYCVVQMGVYQELDINDKPIGAPWYELRLLCMDNGEYNNLEWEEDDGIIEASITTATGELKLRKIMNSDGNPVDPNDEDYDLDDIVKEEDWVKAGGKKFEYEDDYKALYLREGADAGVEVYMYEFEADDGEELTIEEWKEGKDKFAYECWRSNKVDPDECIIISTGG